MISPRRTPPWSAAKAGRRRRGADATPLTEQLDALAALEAELVEREHALSMREATLAGRAGAVLAAAQALYDDVLGGELRPRTTSSPACGGGRAWP